MKKLSKSVKTRERARMVEAPREPFHWRPKTDEDRDALIRLGGDGGIAYDDDAEID